MNVENTLHELGARARRAACELALLSTEQKNAILHAMASGLRAREGAILEANQKDLEAAHAKGLSPAMIDRLRLDGARLEAIARAVEHVATLPDPVGEVMAAWTSPNGLAIEQVRVPIGVIGIIYESRPNVTVDAAALCFKAGNATILRGGSEAFFSNMALAEALQSSGAPAGLPSGAIELVPFTDRASVTIMAQMDRFLDLLIPRGGKSLIEAVVASARMPVIKHYDGICHAYIHGPVSVELACELVLDGKTQKPGVCNAIETVLIDQSLAASHLPPLARALRQAQVELRGCPNCRAIVPDMLPATEEDWASEYLALIVSLKVVSSFDEAISHIHTWGSHHTDLIITEDAAAAERFLRPVDSACVLHNASTRFSDGGEFGFGAEIGISTDKLHARGPMGLRELTSYQYRVRGAGQTKRHHSNCA